MPIFSYITIFIIAVSSILSFEVSELLKQIQAVTGKNSGKLLLLKHLKHPRFRSKFASLLKQNSITRFLKIAW